MAVARWACVWLFPAVLLFGAQASPSVSAERNVILFVTDDHSPDAGCYGNPVIQTPNLDTLARQGVLFQNAFCTTASCSASRSVILTGLHNHANGHYGHEHVYHKFNSYANVVSLPVYLQHAGYRTARCGKFHVAPEAVFHFETVIPGPERNPVQMAENCRGLIESNSERPFFLYFCTADPHRSAEVAKELPAAPNRFGNPVRGEAGYAGVAEVLYDPAKVIVPPFLPDTPACRAELAMYYQSVSRVDQGLGTLVEILRASGQWDRTLFVFLSDHGIAMPGAKTTLYEPGMRSPCIVRNPYVAPRGVASPAMISWVDLAPTVLDFAGELDATTNQPRPSLLSKLASPPAATQQTRAIRPGQFHGRSFLPILTQPDLPGWDTAYGSHTFHEVTMYYPMRVVRHRRHKLIWNLAHPLPFPFASDLWVAPTWQTQWKQGPDASYGLRTVERYMHRPEFELYDLEQDPNETTNLASDPASAPLLQELQREIQEFQRRTHDPWVLKWEYE